jgi:DNA recombination protein RmuC
VLAFIVIWFTFAYAPIAHMVWFWMGPDAYTSAKVVDEMNAKAGLLWQWGALDFAGGTVVHINSGVAGLVGAYLIGKRIGYGKEALMPHNLTLTMIGAALLWTGWFGFNAGSALEANGTAGLAFINTYLATSCAVLSWTLGEAVFKGKPSMLGAASGAVAGLVAITPAAGNVGIAGAFVIGLAAGLVCLWGVNGLKRMLRADDSLDVFGVHAVGGILGALLTGVFNDPSLGRSRLPQQLVRDEARLREYRRTSPDSGQGGRRDRAVVGDRRRDRLQAGRRDDRLARDRGRGARRSRRRLARRGGVPHVGLEPRRKGRPRRPFFFCGESGMAEAALVAALAALALAVWMLFRVQRTLEEKHRQMLSDLHDGLVRQGDRLGTNIGELREAVSAKLDTRLDQISNRVNERLDEGFRKTNDTFVNVMQRLTTIDEAQKKIETLTGSVVELHDLLGDKRTRGAFGEVQLEALVRNVLPAAAFEMQYTLSNGMRVDCVLRLPAPTGMVCVDSKFPLENYNRMLDRQTSEPERAAAQRQFKADVRKHVDDIARKYILAGETSDGAVMFLPAEAVFAEIHAYNADVVDYANTRRVWIVSPTTLMAVLNTARAVLKDVETRKQIDVIKDALGRLAVEFSRFDERMRKLAEHIGQAHEDAQRIQTTGEKISRQFQRIESAELEEKPASNVVRLAEERKPGA